jgi:hypothetical protein
MTTANIVFGLLDIERYSEDDLYRIFGIDLSTILSILAQFEKSNGPSIQVNWTHILHASLICPGTL